MPTIAAHTDTVININVFTVRPEDQPALVDSLVATVVAASSVPEWVSACIH